MCRAPDEIFLSNILKDFEGHEKYFLRLSRQQTRNVPENSSVSMRRRKWKSRSYPGGALE